MNTKQHPAGRRRAFRFATDALLGRLGVAAMVAAYSLCAVALLVYVTEQVYTYSLMEDIANRERKQGEMKEAIGLLMKEYVELSSKERISRICESRFHMKQIETESVERFAIEFGTEPREQRMEFNEEAIDLSGSMGGDIYDITEVMRR
jgi:hypothetical protein